jgi:hypothetical protein
VLLLEEVRCVLLWMVFSPKRKALDAGADALWEGPLKQTRKALVGSRYKMRNRTSGWSVF